MADNTATEAKQPKRSKQKKQKTRKHTPVKAVFILVFIGVIAAGFYVGHYVNGVISSAAEIDPQNIGSLLSESTVIYDDAGTEMDTVFASSNRDTVSLSSMPSTLQNAFIALEDKSFWTHHGFNIIRIFGALKDAFMSGSKVSGTSTITQQLARNLYLPDEQYDYTISRKLTEAYYAMEIEKTLSKEEILEAYLNYIYLGYGCYGVETAAENYFSVDVSQLTIAQCAALAALPQAPNSYELVQFISGGNPAEYPDTLLSETSDGIYVANDISRGRRETCLKLMLDQGYLSQEEYDEAVATPLISMLNPKYDVYDTSSAYFADYVISEVIEDLMKAKDIDYNTAWDMVYNKGLKIYSTMDSQAQSVVLEEFADTSNYPDVLLDYDSHYNIIGRYGQIVLYAYDNYFDSDGNLFIPSDDFSVQEDGSVIVYNGTDLHIYDTTLSDGSTEYSLELPGMYMKGADGLLYTISGGYINIPAKYKTRNDNGDLVISAEFFSDSAYEGFLTYDEEGSMQLPPSSYSLNAKIVQPQAAMTIIENSTGHIKAMVGGRNVTGRKILNRASDVPRQPGSSIKPIGVYSAALQQSAEEAAAGRKHKFTNFGFDKQGANLYGDYLTAGSIVLDEKMTVNGSVWPQNFSRSYSGVQTLRTAVINSLNTCAVKVWYQVGLDYSLQNVKKFGITSVVEDGDANDMNAAALALGGMTKGVTTLEMASAYTVFPNGGTRYDTCAYTQVLDSQGNVLLENNPVPHEVLDPGVAWIMSDIMHDVVQSAAADGAQIRGVYVGGKTGTTNDYFDDWFDGFTPNYTASLWIGNDYGFSLSEHSIVATYMWGNIMRRIDGCYLGEMPSAPGNVVSVGGEYYVSGTQSGIVSKNDVSKKVTICSDSGYLATPECKHTEEKTFYGYGDDKSKAPEYYCHLHNKDVNAYPIAPGETLAPQENNNNNGGESPGTNPPGGNQGNNSGGDTSNPNPDTGTTPPGNSGSGINPPANP